MSLNTEHSAYHKLSPKRQRFVDEYCIDNNATQAAIRAGYSSKTANEQGPRLLVNVSIKKAIEEQKVVIAKENQLKVADVVNELKKIAFVEEVKTSDKLKALELLGSYLNMFTDKLQVDSSGVNLVLNISGKKE